MLYLIIPPSHLRPTSSPLQFGEAKPAMELPRVPTAAEAASLTSLASNSSLQLPPHNFRAELDSILRVCRIPWVADFLFSPDLNSLSALTSPLNMRSAVTSLVSLTNVEVTPTPIHPFDIQLDGAFVFVPSFSVSTISVGFGVQECNAMSYEAWAAFGGRSAQRFSHFRYVRDDANAILFIVHPDSENNQIKMEVMAQSSANKRRRTYAVFDRDALQAALHTERGILHPDAVLPALTMLNTVSENRECPLCPAGTACKCKLEMRRPSHPLDFCSLGDNMTTFLGAYEGLSQSSLLSGGTSVLSAKVGSRIRVEGGVDDALMQRLCRWAITDLVKDVKQTPRLDLITTGEQTQETAQGAVLDPIDLALTGLDQCLDMDFGLDVGPGSTVGLTVGTAVAEKPVTLDEIVQGSSSCSSGTGIIIADTLEDEQEVEKGKEIGGVEDEQVLELVNRITGGMGESRSGGRVEGAGRTVFIAPKTTMLEKDKALGEKEQRMLMRKQRNREAAQRSNMKRKMRNDGLKLALKETHERVRELRAREVLLREENLRLRKLSSS